MSLERVENRLERLERRVTTLEELPERIDRLELQILHFREEVRVEFSAVRDEIRTGDEVTRRVLREDIREGNTMIVTTLVEQIEEVRRHGRVMFAELISRISAIAESQRRDQ